MLGVLESGSSFQGLRGPRFRLWGEFRVWGLGVKVRGKFGV